MNNYYLLWINPNYNVTRNIRMKNQFLKFNLKKTIIIEGYNGKKNNNFFKNSLINKPKLMAITCSHLKAIKYFVENIKEDHCIIAEDNVILNEKITSEKISEKFNILALTERKVNNKNMSASAYLINKEYAKNLLKIIVYKDNTWDFNNIPRNKILAPEFLYQNTNSYACYPIFSYKFDSESTNKKLFSHVKTVNKPDNEILFLYTNLERCPERKKHMENEFEKNGIKKYFRINGFDGKKSNKFYVPFKKIKLNPGVYGNTASHFKAIKHFITYTNEKYCIICEDDVSFEYKPYWKKTLKEYIDNCPKPWDVIILSVTTKSKINVTNYGKYHENINGTVAYCISRKYAQQLLSSPIVKGEIYDFSIFKRPRMCNADMVLYNYSKNIYYLPLLTYTADDSLIHSGHLDAHKKSKEKIMNLWKNS